MRPIIGIVTSQLNEQIKELSYTEIAYTPLETIEGIYKAGGSPFLLPITDKKLAKQYAKEIDGLVLSGGHDVSPIFYGEEPSPNLKETLPPRDEFEIELVKEILILQKPIFAICRGLQILNVALGGNLHQDIDSLDKTRIKHLQTTHPKFSSHSVNIEKDSLLYKLLGKTTLVNTLHHQAIKTLGQDLIATAFSSDGYIEAVESKIPEQYIMAVQWHPEILLINDNEEAKKLFSNFVENCTKK
ncbi:gamma-glutamyl-gamma-aminobutyrate hydrolase family protein [Gemella sp. zg-1178]|uniref:gamma-glutamyl-gamma-aminobutyrate hydrolase family protein n=1 Tax=Gemella sp. zg-1178 TaxID=2840372 RepID=UPI001C05CAAA|nr:gamma-glutamyl-gamma-aminobutyrate hydrolase family protein [Gemella sp. zg-1178]MBU0278880.1 gamma-glutamyl-gamma-aminobutyrate hydrolase family protein [Gemella sp. zg-1178]